MSSAVPRAGYGRLTINDSTINFDRQPLPGLIARAIESIRSSRLPAHFTITLSISSHALPTTPRISDDDDMMSQLLALAEPAAEADQPDSQPAFANDPVAIHYLSMSSPAARQRETPESLALLRHHMETHYPDFVRKHGHSF